MLKTTYKYILCTVLMSFCCGLASAATPTITANVIKDGLITHVSFIENTPVVISQSDVPVAVQFEQVDGLWSMTLFEIQTLRYEDIKKPILSDGVIVSADGVIVLKYVQTYDPCVAPYRLFGTYNFTLQIHCPKSVNTTSD
jgi:hypothetical protein